MNSIWSVTLTLIGLSAGEAFFTRYWGWALSSSFCSCWWPSLRGSLNVTCKIKPPHENAHILFIGRNGVFWLCIATSDVFTQPHSVNLLRWEGSGISGLFVAHHLEAGQILPSGIRRFLQASNLPGACLHAGTIR